MTTTELDSDLLARAADECLTRPSDSAWFDDRLFTTHGCVYTWADRTDDAVSESNYRVWVEDLRGVSGEDFDEHVILAGAGHWVVGHVEHIFVQVYGEDGGYTPAFLRSVENAERLDSYCILDEMDLSEVECEHEERDVASGWITDEVAREARRIIEAEAEHPAYAESVADDREALDHETLVDAYWQARSDGVVERWGEDYQGLDDLARSIAEPFLLLTPDLDPAESHLLGWSCPGQIALSI